MTVLSFPIAPIPREPAREKLPANVSFSIDPHIADSAAWMLREAGLDLSQLTAWEPAAGRGDLMRGLERHGIGAIAGTDLHDHPGRDTRIMPGVDILAQAGPLGRHFNLVATNPPYDDPLCDRLVAHLLVTCPHQWIALLMLASWPFAYGEARRANIDNDRLHAICGLGRRAYWAAPNERGEFRDRPERDHCWLLYRPATRAIAKPQFWVMPAQPMTIKLIAETREKKCRQNSARRAEKRREKAQATGTKNG